MFSPFCPGEIPARGLFPPQLSGIRGCPTDSQSDLIPWGPGGGVSGGGGVPSDKLTDKVGVVDLPPSLALVQEPGHKSPALIAPVYYL